MLGRWLVGAGGVRRRFVENAVESERTLNALLVGADSSRGELRPALQRAGFAVAEQSSLPSAADSSAIVCVALDHPDQFAGEDVRRFLASFAASRILCVRFPWCASMLRSRNDWPAAVVVDADVFEPRLEKEKHVLQGKRAPLPITAGLEEVAAFNRSAGALLLLIILTLSGCGGPSNKSDVSRPKPSWAEQVQAVRSGKTKTITASASSKSDWEMLNTDCSALEALEVDGEVSPEIEFSVLADLPHLKRLKIENGLDDTQAAAISQLPALSELLISSDSLTDKGLESLCRLPLVQLRLKAPNVTDAGAAAIGNLKQLRFLHLIDIPITDATLPAIAKLESLESLYLDRVKCTDEGLSALLKQRPDLHFHRDQVHLRDDPKKHEH
ncbi:hypothetical protein AYO47_05810 [Planctomyces sp. SCGC AG-212-M04]|nr:hypothetical protein AYO47_05810 [Planctomyces sp. SCGC AG-212-M04]